VFKALTMSLHYSFTALEDSDLDILLDPQLIVQTKLLSLQIRYILYERDGEVSQETRFLRKNIYRGR
jgi:hypothetical protein